MDSLDTWEKQEVFRLLKNQPGTMYQETDEEGRTQLRSWVKQLLGNSIITVQFVKADGTVRDMRCTLSGAHIPPAPPRPVPTEIEGSSTANIDGLDILDTLKATKSRKEPDPGTQRVYDLDAGAWRSFRYDRLQKITAEISFAK